MMLAPSTKPDIAAQFGRSAARYAHTATVQYQGAERLFCLLDQRTRARLHCVLDLGCGPGVHTQRLQGIGGLYHGLDISDGMIAQARQAHPSADFICADMESMPFEDGRFDLVFSNFAMQWATSPEVLIREMTRIMCDGGESYFTVVLEQSLSPLLPLRQAFAQKERPEVTDALQTERHASFAQWHGALIDHGLRIEYAQHETFRAWFPTIQALIQSVSKIGADRPHPAAPMHGRAPRLTRNELSALTVGYERFREPKGLPLDYQVGIFKVSKIV